MVSIIINDTVILHGDCKLKTRQNEKSRDIYNKGRLGGKNRKYKTPVIRPTFCQTFIYLALCPLTYNLLYNSTNSLFDSPNYLISHEILAMQTSLPSPDGQHQLNSPGI